MFWKESNVAEANIDLPGLLPSPPECWASRLAPPWASAVSGIFFLQCWDQSRLICILDKHSTIELQPSLLHFIMYDCFACMNVYMPSACLVPREIRKGCGTPGSGVKVDYEPSCGWVPRSKPGRSAPSVPPTQDLTFETRTHPVAQVGL